MSTDLAERPKLVCAEDLLKMPDGDRYELVHGVLREAPASVESSWVGGKFHTRLANDVEESGIGFAIPADLQLRIFSDRNHLRRADALVLLVTSLPGGELPRTGFLEIAPDIAVEVVSPIDEAEDIDSKVQEYLAAGVRLVWVAYPKTRTIHVFHADGAVQLLNERDTLDGAPVLPDFHAPVSSFFRPRQ